MSLFLSTGLFDFTFPLALFDFCADYTPWGNSRNGTKVLIWRLLSF
jgi:hypothetical protein